VPAFFTGGDKTVDPLEKWKWLNLLEPTRVHHTVDIQHDAHSPSPQTRREPQDTRAQEARKHMGVRGSEPAFTTLRRHKFSKYSRQWHCIVNTVGR